MSAQFQTVEAIDAYFSGDRLQCLICGKWFVAMSNHLGRAHGVNANEYKQRFGIPINRGLVGVNLRAKQSSNMTSRLASMTTAEMAAHIDRFTRDTPHDNTRGRKRPPAFAALARDNILNTPNAPRLLRGRRAITKCSACGVAVEKNAMGVKTQAYKLLCDMCLAKRATEREKQRASDPKRRQYNQEYSKSKWAIKKPESAQCTECGKMFARKSRARTKNSFCSHQCMGKWGRRHQVIRLRLKPITCPVCNVVFRPPRASSVCCSRSCSARLQHLNGKSNLLPGGKLCPSN